MADHLQLEGSTRPDFKQLQNIAAEAKLRADDARRKADEAAEAARATRQRSVSSLESHAKAKLWKDKVERARQRSGTATDARDQLIEALEAAEARARQIADGCPAAEPQLTGEPGSGAGSRARAGRIDPGGGPVAFEPGDEHGDDSIWHAAVHTDGAAEKRRGAPKQPFEPPDEKAQVFTASVKFQKQAPPNVDTRRTEANQRRPPVHSLLAGISQTLPTPTCGNFLQPH